ncbi:MAG: hypothetical protein ABID79_00605 [Elusimicrobiota bacterium]
MIILSHKKIRCFNNKGIGLIEIMLCVMILPIIVVGFYLLFSGNTKQIIFSEVGIRAFSLAQEKMESIKNDFKVSTYKYIIPANYPPESSKTIFQQSGFRATRTVTIIGWDVDTNQQVVVGAAAEDYRIVTVTVSYYAGGIPFRKRLACIFSS